MQKIPDNSAGLELDLEKFNPFSPKYLTNPYPFYERYRETEPVHWGELVSPNGRLNNNPGCWYIFKYADCTTMLKDGRLGRNPRNIMPSEQLPRTPAAFKPFVDMINDWVLVSDPPVHTRLRGLLSKVFTSQAVEKLRPRIQEICNFLLEQAEASGNGQLDLIADFAIPLPSLVIAEMIGLPASDRKQLAEWALVFMSGLSLNPGRSAITQAAKATQALYEYLKEIIAERRRNPQDDILSSLVAAEKEGVITEAELCAMIGQLLQAGQETTTNLIGNGVLTLFQNPDQLALLKSQKDLVGGNNLLVENAVEELLRYDSPVQMALRMAFEDIEFGGKLVHKGEEIMVMLGSANRDPEQFPEPDRLDITRKISKHQGFGLGIHFCAGAPLARLETQIAFSTLFSKLPNLGLAVEATELQWQNKVGFRGLKALPLAF